MSEQPKFCSRCKSYSYIVRRTERGEIICHRCDKAQRIRAASEGSERHERTERE